MNVKRIVIPALTCVILFSQLVGCKSASSTEMLEIDTNNGEEAVGLKSEEIDPYFAEINEEKEAEYAEKYTDYERELLDKYKDDEYMLESLKFVMDYSGYDITPADADELIAYAEELRPKEVIVEVQVPNPVEEYVEPPVEEYIAPPVEEYIEPPVEEYIESDNSLYYSDGTPNTMNMYAEHVVIGETYNGYTVTQEIYDHMVKFNLSLSTAAGDIFHGRDRQGMIDAYENNKDRPVGPDEIGAFH